MAILLVHLLNELGAIVGQKMRRSIVSNSDYFQLGSVDVTIQGSRVFFKESTGENVNLGRHDNARIGEVVVVECTRYSC